MSLADDYFQALGLPRRYHLDAAELRARYREGLRLHHPDHAATLDPEQGRRAVAMTALLNAAHKTLSQPATRLEYLLRLHQLLQETPQLPQHFLLEMLERNETLDEALAAAANADPQPLADIRRQLLDDADALQAEIDRLMQAYDDAPTPEAQTAALLPARIGYLQMKYLQRLLDRTEPGNP